ncbi:hypothetical protein QFW77_15200 [Luteimonas sp. RD2P54]|uniref:DUF3077 domain-containing protein n=1 Tax=Luteimonas endophytica TaxID=3042023 RepID=A0ABT6JBW8_9GAMM|nr:hypothetical protein [Luteimonas endophytica]MDH5824321.1 hypothetical protein [Luteimonas endophytica]
MALTTYANIARDIFVALASKGKADKQTLDNLAEYSFKAAQVFVDQAKLINSKAQQQE